MPLNKETKPNQTEGGRRMQPVILIHNFFSWPYYTVLSSRPHWALLLLGLRGDITEGWCGPLPQRALSVTGRSLQSASWDSHWNVGICLYHFITPAISVQHVIVSAYFRSCVLSREYLIDGLVKDEYATIWIISINNWHFCVAVIFEVLSNTNNF